MKELFFESHSESILNQPLNNHINVHQMTCAVSTEQTIDLFIHHLVDAVSNKQ